jgi:tetratricopeptide (TPR) repeat protein
MELRSFTIIAATCAFALSLPALAKPTEPGELKNDAAHTLEAKDAYLEAQKLFKAEEYKLALPLFKKAYDLSHRKPTSILGLAQCERMLKMYDESIAHFKEYLTVAPSLKLQNRINETLKILNRQSAQARAAKDKKVRTQAKAAKEAEILRAKEAELLAQKLAQKMVAAPQREKETIWSNPWLWVGLTVVVAGAATGAGIVLAPEPDIYGGSSGTTLKPQ